MSDNLEVYRHRQTGYVIIFISAAIILFSISLKFFKEGYSGVEFSLLVIISSVILLLFHSLTVVINDADLTVTLGIGLIRKKIPLDRITDSRIVRNSWYTGWGIRVISGGFMFNVSGFSAVELSLKSGNTFRIGTDDQVNLNQKIQQMKK